MDASSTADAPVIDGMSISSEVCWNLNARVLKAPLSACSKNVGEHLEITSNVTIDTSTGLSTGSSGASPITCELILDGVEVPGPDGPLLPDPICALSAKKITISAGVTLSAHGDRPLVLLAHDMDVQGTIDVSSHFGQPPGPGAVQTGCNFMRGAVGAGGGGGGGFNHAGGAGGEQGGVTNSGAAGGATITVDSIRGGCDGTGGGDGSEDGGSPGPGGGGGGAVWISVDTGKLTLGSAATINASGAGGRGGTTVRRGGSGGGSGGLIVLQAPTIARSPSSAIFANGGGGGGGAKGETDGQPGGDPLRMNVDDDNDAGGRGGDGSTGLPTSRTGDGGNGDPSESQNGEAGEDGDAGGGGGGGSIGLIWVSSTTSLASANIDPDPVILAP